MPNKRKCKWCGEYTREYVMTPTGSFCDYDHAVEYAIEYKAKQRKQLAARKRDRGKKQLAERKKALRTRGWYVKRAQAAFNAYIRKRDHKLPCISCGTNNSNLKYDAGHYKTTKAYPELRFHPMNCHKQCQQCNRHLSGNVIEYRKGLAKRYDIELVRWLEGHHKIKKYSIDELERLTKHFKDKIKTM